MFKSSLSLLKKLLNLPDRFDRFAKNIDRFAKNINNKIDKLQKDHKEIREGLISKGIIAPFTQSSSPKIITERGKELLDAHNTNKYLDSHCDLLTEAKIKEFKTKNEAEIFMECFKWVKKNGEEKIFEIMYNSNINKEQCTELLALAIVDKIKSHIHSDKQ